jgi:phosphoribosylformylglycinamidine synthase
MAKPRVLILKAAGINCDVETASAFAAVGGVSQTVHINQLVAREKKLSDYQILAISGGFSYGDDIASGKILANELKFKLADDLKAFIAAGKLVVGICNGFQVLVRSGLLPGSDDLEQQVTLAHNDCGVFQDRWVYLRRPGDKATRRQELCVWTKGLPEVIYLPIAHGEGKFIPKSQEVLDRLEANGQVVFQYSDARGHLGDFPVNPNGSMDSIAGLCDPTGHVLGLMPHPERHVTGLQHPRWTREGLKKYGDGLLIFQNAVTYFK